MRVLIVAVLLAGCGVDDAVVSGEGSDEAADALSASARRDRAQRWLRSAVLARMHMPNGKTVGFSAEQVARILTRARPSMVSGLIRIDADPNLEDNGPAFADFKAVRAAMPGVPFDVVLNACDYPGPDRLIAQMRAINGRLGAQKPEVWFFDFYDSPLHDRERECLAAGPNANAMLRRVAAWAHGQNQLIGGNVWSASALPPDADFYSVPDEQGRDATLEKVARFPAGAVLTVHVENNPQKCKGDDPRAPATEQCRGSSGDEYIWRRGPAQRESYDQQYLDRQDRLGFRYLRPVLFPLSNHLSASGVTSFDREANLPPGQLPYVP